MAAGGAAVVDGVRVECLLRRRCVCAGETRESNSLKFPVSSARRSSALVRRGNVGIAALLRSPSAFHRSAAGGHVARDMEMFEAQIFYQRQRPVFEAAQFAVPDAGDVPVSGERRKGRPGRTALEPSTNEQTLPFICEPHGSSESPRPPG